MASPSAAIFFEDIIRERNKVIADCSGLGGLSLSNLIALTPELKH
jgi:hypothetical protein